MNLFFRIDGETPAKKNSRVTLPSGKTIPGRRFREWHEVALLQLRSQAAGLAGLPVGGPCEVEIKFAHGDLRRRDSDNGVSSVLDALVDAGILEDDNWRIVAKITAMNEYKKGEAFCEVRII